MQHQVKLAALWALAGYIGGQSCCAAPTQWEPTGLRASGARITLRRALEDKGCERLGEVSAGERDMLGDFRGCWVKGSAVQEHAGVPVDMFHVTDFLPNPGHTGEEHLVSSLKAYQRTQLPELYSNMALLPSALGSDGVQGSLARYKSVPWLPYAYVLQGPESVVCVRFVSDAHVRTFGLEGVPGQNLPAHMTSKLGLVKQGGAKVQSTSLPSGPLLRLMPVTSVTDVCHRSDDPVVRVLEALAKPFGAGVCWREQFEQMLAHKDQSQKKAAAHQAPPVEDALEYMLTPGEMALHELEQHY